MAAYLKRLVQIAFSLWLVLIVGLAVAQAGGSPRLRMVHASPDAPNADVYIDGRLTFRNMPYRAISDYVSLSAGNRTVRVVPAGANEPTVMEPTLPLVDGKDYTLLAVGKRDNIQAWQLEDDNSTPADNEARVRMVHASPDAPAVDICLAGQNNCPVTNLTFKNASGYINLAAGTYSLDIRRTGTNEVLLNIPNLRFGAQVVYSLFAMGLVQGEPRLQIIPKIDSGRAPGPPDTGAFLSPEAIVVLLGILVVLGGGTWFVRRRFLKPE